MSASDRHIEQLALRQHGIFNRKQVLTAGFTDNMIRSRLREGAWHRVATGVYRHNAFAQTWPQTLMIAVLAEPIAVVSGKAAAALHGFVGFRPCRPEITVPPDANHRSRLAIIRRSSHIEETRVDSIPVVTTSQTVFDVAGNVPFSQLHRATEDAIVRNLVTIDQIGDRFLKLAALRNTGIAEVRALLDEFGRDGFVPAASHLESLLFGTIEDVNIPYQRQVPFLWREPRPMIVDAWMPTIRVIGEADGRRWHTRVQDFERDRYRDNMAAAHGIHVMRFTHQMLTRQISYVFGTLEARIALCATAA